MSEKDPCYGATPRRRRLWRLDLFAAALLALSYARAAAGDPLDPVGLHALAGPFPTLDAYCAAASKRGRPCRPERRWAANAREPLGASPPFVAARLLVTSNPRDGSASFCRVALATDRGWFVDEDDPVCDGRLGPSSRIETLRAEAAWIEDRRAAVLAVTVTDLHTVDARADKGRQGRRLANFVSERRWLILCGLARDGVPRCTERLLIGCVDDGQQHDFPWTFDHDRLTIESREERPECPIGLVPPIGTHRLPF